MGSNVPFRFHKVTDPGSVERMKCPSCQISQSNLGLGGRHKPAQLPIGRYYPVPTSMHRTPHADLRI